MFGFGSKSTMVTPETALRGRTSPAFSVPDTHEVLGTSLRGPWEQGVEEIYLAAGCFWGVEEIYWALPGVVSTSVGYMGGFSGYPTYEEVCTGQTGHTETVYVAYRPAEISTWDILKVFWESHDPTQGMRQGNDIGTQYRSAIFYTNEEQHVLAEESRASFTTAITDRGYGEITTQILPAADFTYFEAEDYHQQYLYKNPNGYRCHSTTGLTLPARVS